MGGQSLLWSPCCFYSKKIPLLDQEAFKKAFDYTSTAKDWLPECGSCRFLETTRINRSSPRLDALSYIPSDSPNGTCVELELNIDVNCNAACLSCNTESSTTWKKYEYKHRIHDHGIIKDYAPDLLQQLIDTVPMDHVERVVIAGGEPFYSETHIRLIEHLQKIHPDLGKISLTYYTNGSLFPTDYVIEKWKKFKRVTIGVSIDGIKDRFEYLRWPLKWHRVMRTMEQFIDRTNVWFTFNVTTSPLNVFDFQDITNWAYETFPKNRLLHPEFPARFNPAAHPLNLSLAPLELREECKKIFGPEYPANKFFKIAPLPKKDDIVRMIEYIQKHDRLRRLNWRTTFPEVTKYFD